MFRVSITMRFSFPIFFFALFLLNFPQIARGLVINEIAWMGTETSFNDEWIELYNEKEWPADVGGWKLVFKNSGKEISISGTVLAKQFFILERTDDGSLPEIKAQGIYKGALNNKGERLQIFDQNGILVDEVDCSAGWFAGDNETKKTMERKDPFFSGNAKDSWQESAGPGGTPGRENSQLAVENIDIPEKERTKNGENGLPLASVGFYQRQSGTKETEGGLENKGFNLLFFKSVIISFAGAISFLFFRIRRQS